MGNPSISNQITIDATNKFLDVWDEDAGAQFATLVEDTYDDMIMLCLYVEAALQALGGNWAAATCDVSYTTTPVGKIVIDSGQTAKAVSLQWKTGAHGSDNLDTHCGDLLGFSDSADDTSAYSYTSDYQHQYTWYSPRAAVRYTEPDPIEIGGDLVIPLSGKSAKRVHIGFQHRLEAEFALIVPECMYTASATSTNTNRDLETQWKILAAGDWGRWRADCSVTGTYTAVYMIEPRDWSRAVRRPHTDYEAYNIKFLFSKKES